ncbi:Uncharacterised protein [Klebsiella variicola]|nr:Uncharacterised protein [Klebsiella variicola]SLU87970.1 Uncharacterised protein [Klebsiella variicola]SLZ35264.1 Uncharacterised protein [Klebsiella variicola]SLZ60375.1 Uncharacterised protein [Klebsiella variicola]
MAGNVPSSGIPGRRCWTVPLPSGRGVGKALSGSPVCDLRLQHTLRSRYAFCVMSLMAQGAHRGRPVAAAPCTPGLRPATSPLCGAFDLSLRASGRAEAASVQNTALSPHPCGLPRPSGNVSAMLRPPAPAVSAALVGNFTAGRTNPRDRRPGQAQPPPGNMTGIEPDIMPGGVALTRAYGKG